MDEIITNPAHYTSGPACSNCGKTIECIDVSEHFSGNVAQAIQYLWRHMLKGTPSQDLRKAGRFCFREANRLDGTQSWDVELNTKEK